VAHQIDTMWRHPVLKVQYKPAILKVEISKFLKQVQPFGRIIDTIHLLSIRCDLAVLSDFFILRQKRQGLAN